MTTLSNNFKEQVSLTISSLIEIIKHPNLPLNSSSYFYHETATHTFNIYIYIYKLLLNDIDYLEMKFNKYKEETENILNFKLEAFSNIECQDEIDLLSKLKNRFSSLEYYYDYEQKRIIFSDEKFIDTRWLINFLSLIIDNKENDRTKEINICYTIPNKDIIRIEDAENLNNFLSQFQFYSIKVKHTDNKRPVKENNILVVKNAAINYLKHLKQYKHGLEDEESYLIFYNLLKKECHKEGFELEEKELNLLDIDSKLLDKIYNFIDEEFYKNQLSKQVHLIENIVWQSSNDITLLEHMNNNIDNLLELLRIINNHKTETYASIKQKYNINDIRIILILITSKFLLTYLCNSDELDYSLLSLTNIKPKYMNSICRNQEQELKNHLKSLDVDLVASKKELERYKEERNSLNIKELGADKYKKELERCVSNINRASIIIARLNSTTSSLSKEYEDLKRKLSNKYRNIDLYNYNHSIIRHLCNSIIGCSFYLKTNNTSAIFSNIIIFEDYEKTDNSFYLEVSFKELLKISSQYLLNGIIAQNDLPKLAS